MTSIYTGKQAPIRGPFVKHAFAKSVHKGEDAWLQQRDVVVSVPTSGGLSPFLLGKAQRACPRPSVLQLPPALFLVRRTSLVGGKMCNVSRILVCQWREMQSKTTCKGRFSKSSCMMRCSG